VPWVVVSLEDALSKNDRLSTINNILRSARIDPAKHANQVRELSLLNAVALETDLDSLPTVRGLAGVALAIFGGRTSYSDDGFWYANLAIAWERLLGIADGQIGVINMSLAPPSRVEIPVDSNEIVQRAAKKAWDRGLLPVVAAGNWGRAGEDTLSPWAYSPYVVSVGAADVGGSKLSAFSSIGTVGGRGPTIVGPESQIPPTGSVGTSFAAPFIADAALLYQTFLYALWQSSKKNEEELRQVCCTAVLTLLTSSARTMPGAPHERGAGFLDISTALEWLQLLTPEKFRKLLPTFPIIEDALFHDVQKQAKYIQTFTEQWPVIRIVVDEEFEWVRPIFIPGLYPVGTALVFRQITEIHQEEEIDWALTPVGRARFIEITIRPWRLRGTMRRVGQGQNEYSSIRAAIQSSEPGDIVFIPKGRHQGPIQLKFNIKLQGETGSIIASATGPALIGEGIDDVAVKDLTLETTASRASAVELVDCDDIGFENCIFHSSLGNGVNALLCRRIMFNDCDISGQINGAFVGLGQELRWQSCTIDGQQSGLVLLGTSGWLYDATVNAGSNAILYVGFDFPWHFDKEVTVFLYPFAKEILPTKDVRLQNLISNAKGAWLARILFGLQIEKSRLSGKQTGIVANNFHFINLESTSYQGSWSDLGLIRVNITDQMRSGKSPLQLLHMTQDLIAKVEIEAVSRDVFRTN
jgi:Subtilase family